jgi:hypothetical protein
MVAYYRAVRDLEDKFHGIELHHVLCGYSKAADTSHKLVPHGVFASDQHVPSIRDEGERSQDPKSRSSQTSRTRIGIFPSSSGLSKERCPLTRRRRNASRGELRLSSSSRVYFVSGARQVYSCNASWEIKARSCFVRSTPAHADITPAREPLSERLSDNVSTGPWW